MEVSIRDRGMNLVLSGPNFVYESSKGSGMSGHSPEPTLLNKVIPVHTKILTGSLANP